MRIKATFAAACLAVVAFSGQAHAFEPWPLSKPYTAGSAGIVLDAGAASVNQAGGALDCSSGQGGACFNTQGHRGEFTVRAVDDVAGSVGIFMGFDIDGDGCVGCTGAADVFFQGTDKVVGFIPPADAGTPDLGRTLFVFVRAATLPSVGAPATTGEVTATDGCQSDDGQPCKIDFAEGSGTFCVERDPTTPPDDGCHHLPYPYPGVGG